VSTFVSHYKGADQLTRTYGATWQGIYLSCASYIVVLGIGFFSGPLFDFVGHEPNVRILETQYFEIMCWGGIGTLASSAVSGYFSGTGRTCTLMWAQFTGFVVNIILDYLLIFGKCGFPGWGVPGAAIATTIAQILTTLILLIVFLCPGQDCEKASRHAAFNFPLMKRILRFGFPSGLRWGFEMLAWTLFLFIVGRIGTVELAATNIAFRINGFAFFPIVGLGQAVGILVGQAQGRRDPVQSERLTYMGLAISEAWMITAALIFIIVPAQLFNLFSGGNATEPAEFVKITSTGITLLRFVAVYSLLDASNIIFLTSLQCAGDTRWTLAVSIIAHLSFLILLLIADHLRLGIWVEWSAATLFVVMTAMVWFRRFQSGKWQHIRVIEYASFEEEDSDRFAETTA